MSLIFTIQGRNYMLDVALNEAPQVLDWYVALYEGDYSPQDDDTAANIGARATEITAYAEATRPKLNTSAATAGTTSNAADLSKVTLTANKSVRAFAILSAPTKGASTGILLAYQRLSSVRAYGAGDVVKIPVTLTLANPA